MGIRASRKAADGWRRFVAAYSANITGDRFADLAIPVTSLAISGDIRLAGVYVAANSIPRFVIGPLLAGRLQRRPDRSWCSYGNWVQALALLFLAVCVLTETTQAWAFAAAGLLAGIGAGIFGLAARATVRNLVPNEKLASANAALEVVDSLFTILIPLVAGVLVELTGPGPVIALTAIAFSVAALLRTGLWVGDEGEPVTGTARGGTRLGHYFADMKNSLVAPFTSTARRFVSVGVITLGAGSLLLIPVASFQIDDLGGTSVHIGIAISAAGAGGLVASFLAGRFSGIARSARWTAGFLIAVFVSVPFVLLTPTIALVVALVALGDALASWLYVALPTLRMAMESSKSLLPITAGMMSWNALGMFAVGTGVSAFGAGTQLVVFVSGVCGASMILVLVFGRRSHLKAVQRLTGA